MKKLIAISTMTLVLTTCGVSSQAYVKKEIPTQEQVAPSFWDFIIETKEQEAAQLRASKIQKRITELQPYVDNTWYAFGASTPEGWDCSGLVIWFYSEFQVKLQHSVTAQINSGKIVDKPMPGDIVAFKHNGSSMGYHNGLYIGNNLFIHSPKVGAKTKISFVSKYAGEHSEIVFTRIDF